MNKPKILIVDDEKETIETLKDFISARYECEIFEALDGYKAIDFVKNQNIDFILLDIKMPGLSGIDVIKEVKTINDNIAIIIISRWDSPDVAEKVKAMGVDYYIPKPLALKVLKEHIEESLKNVDKLFLKS